MVLKELLHKHNWPDIRSALVRLYPDQKGSIIAYKKVFRMLRAMQPTETKMRIVIENIFDECEGKYYASVSGKNGTLRKEEEPEIFKDDSEEMSWGLDFTDWGEWLGMEIDSGTLASYSGLDIIAHCLWEMTWWGFTPEKVEAESRMLEEIADRAKAGLEPLYDHEEVWKEMEKGA